MAKMNGTLYFSKKQLETMLKGKEVGIWREGKRLVVGMKKKHTAKQVAKLQHLVSYYQKKLKSMGVEE